MIKTLEVKNFKSIKHLKINCKRVNVFIGEPNAGKSNILESLGVFSVPYGGKTEDFIRIENDVNLFHNHDTSKKIEVMANSEFLCEMGFDERERRFEGRILWRKKGKKVEYALLPYGQAALRLLDGFPFKFYRFRVKSSFGNTFPDFLLPPDGDNLLALFKAKEGLKELVVDIFRNYGLKVVLRPYESKIEVQIEDKGILAQIPYSLVSDTLQRMVFHLAAIETNKNSILIFEEPEAHAFPFYTKYLAELIADDESNQYFISTHNPYLLTPILGKTPSDQVEIFLTYLEDYQTKVKPLTKKERVKVLDLGASTFFNLNRFLG